MTAPIARPCLLIFALLTPVAISAQEDLKWRIPPDWELGNIQETRDELLMEYVKKSEKIGNWTELLTVQQFRRTPSSPSPRQFYDLLKATREKSCPGLTEWQIVEEDDGTLLYEWRTTGICGGHPPQSELARLIFARDNGYRSAFTTRAQLTPEMRAVWVEWLRSLSLGGR